MIIPSMLSANASKLGDELISVHNAGADAIHWDVMDGLFVESITFGHHVISAHRELSNLRFDVHLMVENPERHIKNFAQAGADIIIVHAEACKHLHKVLGDIKLLGKKSGVALNPATSPDGIDYCADIVDMVLVMGVNPGSCGQSFIRSQLNKISNLRKRLPPSVEICIDGGITVLNIKECIEHGAHSFVSGSHIFRSPDYSKTIQKMKLLSSP
ncbi:MAG: ribulose-phosphate 3-epimerase [Holosporaceae bacterium]|jgi:ribulose-phosphate 3-epimerase|nr:ribulose-phosphate 3-epimerase [Holosporaceae bacterium]